LKYIFKNIAQKNLARTIVLVLAGLAMWITMFCVKFEGISTIVGLFMVAVNSLLLMEYCYKMGWTNLPSSFVAATTWVLLSAFSTWQLGWQVHIVATEFLICLLVLSNINVQHQATEQAYALSLMCCVLSPNYIIIGIGVAYVLTMILIRSRITWKVPVAALIGIATYVLYAAILRYFGWLETLWMENLPSIDWKWWLIGLGVYVLLWAVLYLPLKKPSLTSGIIYSTSVVAAVVACVLKYIPN
jgi:hypothetical protein